MRSYEIRKSLNVSHFSSETKISLLLWFGVVTRMFQETSASEVLVGTPTGKRPKGRLTTRWSDNISDLAWLRLGVEPAELFEIAENLEVFRVFLVLLLPRIFPEKSGYETEWKRNTLSVKVPPERILLFSLTKSDMLIPLVLLVRSGTSSCLASLFLFFYLNLLRRFCGALFHSFCSWHGERQDHESYFIGLVEFCS